MRDMISLVTDISANLDAQTFVVRVAHAGNSTYLKGEVSRSKDSLVVNGTLVFQIKFYGKSPALRVAPNRYRQA